MSFAEDMGYPNAEEYDEEISGALLLKQVPDKALKDRVAYALPEEASPEQIKAAVNWLESSGCTDEIVYQDENGFLTRRFDPSYGYTYEFMQGPCLIVLRQDGGIESWGHVMLANYGWEVVAKWG